MNDKTLKDFIAQMNGMEALDFPEPDPCKKCGRVIYCGVSKMCQEKNCELKSRQSLQANV